MRRPRGRVWKVVVELVAEGLSGKWDGGVEGSDEEICGQFV